MVGGRADGGQSQELPAARPSGAQRPSEGGAKRARAAVSLWGVLNVTPDSFSDGGQFLALEAALARARVMLAEGADVIDVGGASSRPRGRTYGEGAPVVPADEEIARTAPAITLLARALGARVSIDTTSAEVARAALDAGASIVNDVSMGASEALVRTAAEHGAELVLMHTRGDGAHTPEHTTYRDVVIDVRDELARAVERVIGLGVREDRVWIDPGIGFAKTAAQSAALLGRLDVLVALGPRVLVGASRKSFLAALAPGVDGSAPPPGERLPGSLVALTAGVLAGAAAVRVHDVAASRQALLVAAAIAEGAARG